MGIRCNRYGLIMLAVAVAFSAFVCFPEIAINKAPLNDLAFHVAASEQMGQALSHYDLNPWVPEWALGYPLWLTYQPLPHMVSAVAMNLGISFSLFYYLLLVTFPVSVYVGSRKLGLEPEAAGLASMLVLLSSAGGLYGGYGIGYGATVWRGTGLYAQLFALHLMILAIGYAAEGRRKVLAGVLLGATGLSHIVFGYVAVVSILLLYIRKPRTIAPLLVWAAVLSAWFVVPMWLGRGEIGYSKWEPAWKAASFGTGVVREVLSGRLLDFGRLPSMTLLVGIGLLGCRSRKLLVLAGFWLVMFIGWGSLITPHGFPTHRLQAPFELFLMLAGCSGVYRIVKMAVDNTAFIACLYVLGPALVLMGVERAEYMHLNTQWGTENIAAYERERPELDAAIADIQRMLDERPGRVSAGLAATWGNKFKVGYTPVFSFLTKAHIDEASFLYHAMSRTSDEMVERDENSAEQDRQFGIRAVLAPVGMEMPPHLKIRSTHGRFAVYESSTEGYFSAGKSGEVRVEAKVDEAYGAAILASQATLVTLKITYSPDLKAKVDGITYDLVRSPLGFCQLYIPAGLHHVTVTYSPGPLKPALFILGLCLVWLRSLWHYDTLLSTHSLTASAWARKLAHLAGLLLRRPERWSGT